jgi:CubicO group peptidase (beta-lactamase class C family)
MHRPARALLSILLLMGALLGGAPAKAQTWPTREWPVSTPEAEGMSSESLARLVEFGQSNNMDSLLVTRHGAIVLEATYAPFRAGLKHRINSATKAVVSTLLAMAMRDGLLDSADRHVVDFFADRTVANLDDNKRAMTIRHLLDMTSGLDWIEPFGGAMQSLFAMERSTDWEQYVLDRPMAAAPGTLFHYNSGNSQLLSAILTKLAKRSTLDYARENLFGPLGIEDVQWRQDPQGISTGGFGLYLQPRDMAKIGYLYLRDGQWEGKQILPASWIAGVRKADVDMHLSWTPNLRYGSQFWVIPSRDAYMAVGFHGQMIIVLPKLDVVAVTTGSARFPGRDGPPSVPRFNLETLVGRLAAAVKSDAVLPADAAASADLADRLKTAGTESVGTVNDSSALAKVISGRTYRFPDNVAAIRSIIYRLDEPQPSYEYELRTEQGRFGGPIGFDGRYRVGGHRPYGPSAARAWWLADGKSLVLDVQTLGNDDAARVTQVFTDKSVEATFKGAGGFSVKLQGQADE